MSGDIGRGATRESIAFALRLAAIKERPHGLYLICYAAREYHFFVSAMVLFNPLTWQDFFNWRVAPMLTPLMG